MNTKDIGNWGESIACDFLIKKGHTILKRNYHTRYGEIDIISRDGSCIVFVEVKTRKNSHFAAACEYVDKKKQEKIILSAYSYMGENTDQEVRFDVIEVYYNNYKDTLTVNKVNHINNAFILT